jgi:hypothetical protein
MRKIGTGAYVETEVRNKYDYSLKVNVNAV